METVSCLFELPVATHEALKEYVAKNPGWDQDRVAVLAIARFLLDANTGNKAVLDDWMTARLDEEGDRGSGRIYGEAN